MTMLLSVLEFVCLSCCDNQTKQREDTEKKGMKEEGNEKSVTWEKEATASYLCILLSMSRREGFSVRWDLMLYLTLVHFALLAHQIPTQSLQTLAWVIFRFSNCYSEMDNCVCRAQSSANTLRLASIHFEPFERAKLSTFNFSFC